MDDKIHKTNVIAFWKPYSFIHVAWNKSERIHLILIYNDAGALVYSTCFFMILQSQMGLFLCDILFRVDDIVVVFVVVTVVYKTYAGFYASKDMVIKMFKMLLHTSLL